jgi:hypothetical protein
MCHVDVSAAASQFIHLSHAISSQGCFAHAALSCFCSLATVSKMLGWCYPAEAAKQSH